MEMNTEMRVAAIEKRRKAVLDNLQQLRQEYAALRRDLQREIDPSQARLLSSQMQDISYSMRQIASLNSIGSQERNALLSFQRNLESAFTALDKSCSEAARVCKGAPKAERLLRSIAGRLQAVNELRQVATTRRSVVRKEKAAGYTDLRDMIPSDAE